MSAFLLVISPEAALAALAAKMLRMRQIEAVPVVTENISASLSPECAGVIAISDCDGVSCTECLQRFQKPMLFLNGAAVDCCKVLGGQCEQAEPYGRYSIEFSRDSLFKELDSVGCIPMSPVPLQPPEQSIIIEKIEERGIGFRLKNAPVYAVQYPIERNDPDAGQLLWNFAVSVCGMKEEFSMEASLSRAMEAFSSLPSEDEVLCTVSGGVDSSVCAVLAKKALGDRVHFLMIDHGFLRQDEADEVEDIITTQLKLSLERIDSKETFFHALRGIQDEKGKEKAFSSCMAEVLRRYILEHPKIKAILLGTNLSDRLYSTVEGAEVFPNYTVLEPIRGFFKEEIRMMADELSLPTTIVTRQPFPGTGLALRVWGEATTERLKQLRAADYCFCRKLEENGYSRKLFQYYATLCDNPASADSYAVCLRAVMASQSGGVAARLPYDILEDATSEIMREQPKIKRVVYDLSASTHFAREE